MYLCNNPACQNTISFFFLFFFLARLSNYPLNPLVLAEIAVSVAYYMMFMFYVYCRYLFSKWCGIQKHHIIDKIHKYLKYSLVPPPGVQSVSKTWRNFLLYCLVNFFFYHKSHHSLGCLCLCVNYACVKCHGNKPTRSPSPLFSLGNRPFSSSGTNEQV